MLEEIQPAGVPLWAFLGNPVFLSSLVSLVAAQVLKAVVYAVAGRVRGPGEILGIVAWRTGGMPSSHAAVVCALCASIAIAEGMSSNVFVLSFWFALIVLRDSMGVRRTTGLSTRALNVFGKKASEKLGLDFDAVKEVQGHTPIEVVMGGILGILIAAAVALALSPPVAF